ncbi:MAG: NAD(P)H-hydrate epimerase, partial [Henriciella sp.]|uniref:NAD(P)H-hydrate epimerase n=1 Tax=Henriciella sp. TaxID=1968823 RepID=UPI003C764A6A
NFLFASAMALPAAAGRHDCNACQARASVHPIDFPAPRAHIGTMSQAIITPQQMYDAEQALFDAGTDSFDLMEVAGRAVGRHCHEAFPDGDIAVLCGTGGNGGDGFVAADELRRHGRTVRVYSMNPVGELSGDVAKATTLWGGEVELLDEALSDPSSITLDALFGGGLSRPLEGTLASLTARTGKIVSVDVPSGLDGQSARPVGPCFSADLTVTFAAYRYAHILSPGRRLCGRVIVEDIGVPVPRDVVELGPDIRAGDARGSSHAAPIKTLSDNDLVDSADNLIEAARTQATAETCLLIVRGEETLIAGPDGRCAVHPGTISHAITDAQIEAQISALRSDDWPAFEAACAALWSTLTQA